ncbi:TPA: hypothetical protein ACH3X2_002932 [Trebouxia sp. C0005]
MEPTASCKKESVNVESATTDTLQGNVYCLFWQVCCLFETLESAVNRPGKKRKTSQESACQTEPNQFPIPSLQYLSQVSASEHDTNGLD